MPSVLRSVLIPHWAPICKRPEAESAMDKRLISNLRVLLMTTWSARAELVFVGPGQPIQKPGDNSFGLQIMVGILSKGGQAPR